MKRLLLWIFIVAVFSGCLLINSCGKDKKITAPTVVASEIWSADIGGGQGTGTFTFEKLSDGVVRTSGEWIFGYVICPFTSGPGATLDSVIAFSSSGTATNQGGSSAFTLSVTGVADSGQATGMYSIIFAVAGWGEAPLPHTWTATRTSGSGITP